MSYKIKIRNSQGTMYSTEYDSKREAQSIIKKNRQADALINRGGLRAASTGRLVRINNKYKLIKE